MWSVFPRATGELRWSCGMRLHHADCLRDTVPVKRGVFPDRVAVLIVFRKPPGHAPSVLYHAEACRGRLRPGEAISLVVPLSLFLFFVLSPRARQRELRPADIGRP